MPPPIVDIFIRRRRRDFYWLSSPSLCPWPAVVMILPPLLVLSDPDPTTAPPPSFPLTLLCIVYIRLVVSVVTLLRRFLLGTHLVKHFTPKSYEHIINCGNRYFGF